MVTYAVYVRAGGQLVDFEVNEVNRRICNELFLKVSFQLKLKKVINVYGQCIVTILEPVDPSNSIRIGPPRGDAIKSLHTAR